MIMSNVIQFPEASERQWHVWEAALREGLERAGIPVAVVEHALPRLRGHWEVVFEDIELELPKRPVPGQLTARQAQVIQSIIEDGAALVVRRLQHERRLSFDRLIEVEVALSRRTLEGGAAG